MVASQLSTLTLPMVSWWWWRGGTRDGEEGEVTQWQWQWHSGNGDGTVTLVMAIAQWQ